MPQDLFGDVLVPPRSVRSRRSSVVIVSLVAHGAAIVVLVIAPLLAIDALPIPQRAATFFVNEGTIPVVPAPSRPRVPNTRTPASGTPMEPAPSTPHEAPSGISVEPGPGPGEGPVGSGGPRVVGIIEGMGPALIGPIVMPQAPPPPSAAPVRLHAGIRAPQKIVDVPPAYPPLARAAHIQGIVIIEATIDAHGSVEAARVLRSIALLDQAALDAVKQWKFSPTLLNGTPVPIIMTVTVNFRLQ